VSSFASFGDLSAHLEKLGLFRIRPELGRLRLVIAAIEGNAPLRNANVNAQIAGTNGKGSTSTFIASMALALGRKTGLFTSPHFVSFRERIRVNGEAASEEILLEEANRIMAAGGEALTYFELVTVLAALVFARENTEAVVWETGLGGTWDATTALDIDMVAYAPIGLDHCAILGDTLGAIAKDKAGAMRSGKPVFTAPQQPEALRALEEAAKEKNCPFTVVAQLGGEFSLGLSGNHQRTNAALALAVWRAMAAKAGWQSSPVKEAEGLGAAFIPGRLQYVPPCPEKGHPAFLLDGAHNGHGMAALGKALAENGTAPAAVIFSCLEDKLKTDIISHLRVLSTSPIFVPPIPDNPRALAPEKITEHIGLAASPAKNMEDSIQKAAAHIAAYLPEEAAAHPERHPVLVCGSLYMLGEFFALRPDCLTAPLGECR
jgi:dihydrofolate synthase/folylpolyglutamate synthase